MAELIHAASSPLLSSLGDDPWRITETGFRGQHDALAETLFALGNGTIGLRGTHEEIAAAAHLEGTYLNGFYESEAIRYPENAYGLARTNQFMLNVPNAKGISIYLDDELLAPETGKLLSYARTLDFRTGLLLRQMEWQSPQGKRVLLVSRRLVSFTRQRIYAIDVELTALNFNGQIKLVSRLDGVVTNMQAGDDPRVGSAIEGASLHLEAIQQTAGMSTLRHRTHNSGFALLTAMRHQISVDAEVVHERDADSASSRFQIQLNSGKRLRLSKFVCYVNSRDVAESELSATAQQALAAAQQTGFDGLCAEQRHFLDAYWQQANVEIAGDPATQQGLRFNQFHLLQSVGRDGKTNIAAKGVTGEGYEGHYFWDTEIYIFPYFLCTQPEIAKKLLEFRYSGLEQARARARQMAHARGALYPWRTIAGDECSAYFPAGTAQYHINADIAHAVRLYWNLCRDQAFLLNQGAEMVWETARIWLDLGHIDHASGKFFINEVTGPDEYTALVNNNYYTNLMAQQHLLFALEIAGYLTQQHPEAYRALCSKIDLSADELAQWQQAAQLMYLPYDAAQGLSLQDDSFLRKKKWDFANTPAENYPLLLHYHPLVIYRHQVCKQADVVLALLLQSRHFSLEQKRRDFAFYESVTTHDSSLSSCIFSIIAAEVGDMDKAYRYFMETARLDLDNTHANTEFGIHTAAMAGTWMCVTMGFAGLRLDGEFPRFQPRLPAQWQHYQFKLCIGASVLQVRIDKDSATYTLLSGAPLRIAHGATELYLQSGWNVSQPLQVESNTGVSHV